MSKRGPPVGSKNAIGGKRAYAKRPAGADAKARSKAITAFICTLHDERGLTFDQIVARLSLDFDYQISRAAVWQRYQRGKTNA